MELIEFNENIPTDTKNEYQRLINQYDILPYKQKQALIAYKSFLFLFMSRIMQVKDYDKIDFEALYNEIKGHERFSRLQSLLELEFAKRITGKNMAKKEITSFIKPAFSMYGQDPERSLKMLIEALVPICKTLEESFGCMKLEKDIEVYRGTKAVEDRQTISASPVVSTALFKETAFSFVDDDGISWDNNLGNVYTLKVKKGTPVLVCPIGFHAGLQERSNQFEIMFLNKDIYSFVGDKERKKTFYSTMDDQPITVDCLKGVVYPKGLQFSEEEIKSDLKDIITDVSTLPLQFSEEQQTVMSQNFRTR